MSYSFSDSKEMFKKCVIRMQNFCFNCFAAHNKGFKTRTCSPTKNSLFLTRDMKGSLRHFQTFAPLG